MTSTIKVDTISEYTSANGVAIDGLTIKDGGITATTGDVVFNEASASVDLRVETNGQTHALFVDGSADAIGLFNSAPSFTSGQGMHLADDVKIGFGTGGSSRPDFQLSADSSNLKLACGFGGDTADINISTGGIISTGQETSPDAGTSGITLNQGANDTNIITLKSSDVDHPMTALFETDTYGVMQKNVGADGGLRILGLSDDDPALLLQGFAATDSGSVNASAKAIVHIDGRKSDGSTSVGGISSNNLVAVSNDGTNQLMFTGDGQIYTNNGTAVGSQTGTFDAYEDAHLVRAWDLVHKKGVIDSEFDKFVGYNHEKLADLKLVGREEDGTPNHFVNVTGMQRLHNGAIWQQYEKHQKLANAMYELAKVAVGEEKANEILEENDIKLLN